MADISAIRSFEVEVEVEAVPKFEIRVERGASSARSAEWKRVRAVLY
jgi:hypothetical protein